MSQVAARKRILHAVRASLVSSISHSKPPQIVGIRSWIKGFESRLPTRPVAFDCTLPGWSFCRQGGAFGIGTACGASLYAGIITIRPEIAYSFDGHGTSMDMELQDSVEGLDEDYNQKLFWSSSGKLLLPMFFALTVLLGLDRPMQLVVKVILFLLSTKPSPLSVYLFIEQMRYRCMLQEPHNSRLQSLHANKVEVHDYKFLCLARVEMRDHKLTLVGILGGWWKLPQLPTWQHRGPEIAISRWQKLCGSLLHVIPM
ncbi:hypothetical protein SAY86_015507 [Trapa natans]|uniref:Uncharacterized protein n=1 Tax=Trapa natans TaxID=22666 RepID=A0AAN7LI36_TRANT|nr:hypothetical protein SAY86_015507 [Trapa natans]